MNYSIFRLNFKGGVHIGEGSLADCGLRFRADTVFSALCMEALKMGGEAMLSQLVAAVRSDRLILSDAFPFVGGEYFVPKPAAAVRVVPVNTDAGARKVYKQLKYIPLDMLDEYAAGDIDIETAACITEKMQKELGETFVFTRVAVQGPGDTLPYHVGTFTFAQKAGLYVVAGACDEARPLFYELLKGLSCTGLGGKRSSGLGRFSVEEEAMPEEISTKLTLSQAPAYMTLSVSLPTEDEMEKTLTGAGYVLVRRGGYVHSDTYATEPQRKRDLYVLDSGAVVRHRFAGDVYDVSCHGAHPVFRYAKPLLLGVDL